MDSRECNRKTFLAILLLFMFKKWKNMTSQTLCIFGTDECSGRQLRIYSFVIPTFEKNVTVIIGEQKAPFLTKYMSLALKHLGFITILVF